MPRPDLTDVGGLLGYVLGAVVVFLLVVEPLYVIVAAIVDSLF